MIKNKTIIFFIFLFFVLLFFLSLLIIYSFYIIEKNVKVYKIKFEEGLSLIDKKEFNKALLIFESLYKSGYRTESVLMNCIYLYNSTNRINDLYVFIRKSIIEQGFDLNYKKYLTEFLSNDYGWFFKIYFFDYLNRSFIIIILIISFILLVIINFATKKKKNLRFFSLLFILINFCIICLFFIKISYYFHRNDAISISQSDIYNFPTQDSEVLFSIKDYINLKIMKEFEDFALIKLDNGKTGWIPKKNIIKVFNDK